MENGNMTYEQLCQFVLNPDNAEKVLPVELYQGTGLDKIGRIINNHSAGGGAADAGCGKPTDLQGKEQAKGNHGQGNPIQGIVEYSINKGTAMGFGRRTGCEMAVVMIKAKYLQVGSRSEYGFCCFETAPVESARLEKVPGPKVNLIGAGGRFLNAD